MKTQLVRKNGANTPFYATKGAAGFDLAANETITIPPHETKIIPTGLRVKLPEGTCLMIVPRSGISLKTPLRVSNSPGIVDEDYRGEIGILIHNTGSDPYTIQKGERIAQGVTVPYIQTEFIEVEELPDTERGEGGFGSTGV